MRVNARGPVAVHASVGPGHARAERSRLLRRRLERERRLVDPGMGVYCASKAALSMLVKVAAAEWGPLGLRVNGVGPGVTRTPMLGHGPGERRSKARPGWPAWRAARPSAVWARPTTWPARSSPSTTWTGSPARCSSATAGSRCAARSTPSPRRGRAGRTSSG